MSKTRFPHPRPWTWPNGAKIALSVAVPFEAFNLRSQYAQKPKPGKRDPFSLSFAQYGWKSGAWRILGLLDEFGIKGSMSPSGLAAVEHPGVLKTAAGEGYDMVGHGWVNDHDATEQEMASELHDIRRCSAAIVEACGLRPRGWVSPGNAGSPNTPDLLAGEGYLWHGDDASDDLPFLADTKNGKIVVLPKTNIPHNDLLMWLISNNSPEVMWDNFKTTFDELYTEGEAGSPKWIELTLHSHVAGRATLIPIIRKCLRYAADHGDVWFARKIDIADWTLKRAT